MSDLSTCALVFLFVFGDLEDSLLLGKEIEKVFEKLDKFKSENRFYEFTDVAMKAMRILKENEDICEEVKASFYENFQIPFGD